MSWEVSQLDFKGEKAGWKLTSKTGEKRIPKFFFGSEVLYEDVAFNIIMVNN